MFLGTMAGNITLAASAVALGGTFVWLVKSKSLRRIALETNIEDRWITATWPRLPGDTGVALSRLNPIGQVMVNDIEVEASRTTGISSTRTRR